MDINKMFPEAKIFVKSENDALTCKELLDYLRSKNIDTLILTGITGVACVRKTAESALEKGFKVILVKDCIESRKSVKNLQERFFEELKNKGAVIIESKSLYVFNFDNIS